MKLLSLSLKCVFLILTAVDSVHAQNAKVGGDIKAGVIFLSNSMAKSIAGNTPLSIGADYDLSVRPYQSTSSLYLDYNQGNRSGGHLTTWGLGIASKASGARELSESGNIPYGGAGLGIYHVDVDDPIKNVHGSGLALGGKIFAGIQFKSGIVLEANYQIVRSVKQTNPNGVGIQVGFAFR